MAASALRGVLRDRTQPLLVDANLGEEKFRDGNQDIFAA
jgi:hypothetical protein